MERPRSSVTSNSCPERTTCLQAALAESEWRAARSLLRFSQVLRPAEKKYVQDCNAALSQAVGFEGAHEYKGEARRCDCEGRDSYDERGEDPSLPASWTQANNHRPPSKRGRGA